MAKQKIGRDRLRQRKNWLYIRESPFSENPLPLSFGCGLDLDKHSLSLAKSGQDVSLHARGTDSNGKYVQIFPPYQAADRVTHPKLGKIDLDLWVVNRAREKQIAQAIIDRTHYLKPVHSGIFLGVRFKDTSMEKQLRKSASSRRNSNNRFVSSAWTNPEGQMIGCATLGTLLFGVPHGRNAFAESILGADWIEQLKASEKARRQEEREPRPGELTRSRVVRKLGLAWGSRFALEIPYVGLGIGTVLAKHLKKVASHYRLPPAQWIEVIRTVKKEKAQKLVDEETADDDFLTRAGYTIAKEHIRYARPKWKAMPKEGHLIPPDATDAESSTYRKLYYYAEI